MLKWIAFFLQAVVELVKNAAILSTVSYLDANLVGDIFQSFYS